MTTLALFGNVDNVLWLEILAIEALTVVSLCRISRPTHLDGGTVLYPRSLFGQRERVIGWIDATLGMTHIFTEAQPSV